MNASRLKRTLAAVAATAAALIFAMPLAHAVHLHDFQLDGDAKEIVRRLEEFEIDLAMTYVDGTMRAMPLYE